MLAAQVADASGERQPADARRRDDAGRHRQAEQLRLAVEVAQVAPPCTHVPSSWVDVDRVHPRQVDHEASVARVARHVVAAAPHRREQPVLAREIDASTTSAAPEQRTISAGGRSARSR